MIKYNNELQQCSCGGDDVFTASTRQADGIEAIILCRSCGRYVLGKGKWRKMAEQRALMKWNMR